MPKLFLYKDFPECKCDPEVLNNGSVSSLKQKCVDFFKKNTSCSNMLCIVSDEENWEVLYPVISDGSGKKEHPKDYRGAGKGLGWNWDSNANNIENHREFTSKLKKHNTFSYISECEPEDSDDIAEMDILENDKNNQPDCELEKKKKLF